MKLTVLNSVFFKLLSENIALNKMLWQQYRYNRKSDWGADTAVDGNKYDLLDNVRY